MYKSFWLSFCLLLFAMSSTAQSFRINEVMSSNVGFYFSRSGESPDWIELYNSGINTENLIGYGLSDVKDEPFKWIFPDYAFSPDTYLIIFASGNDLKVGEFHTNFKISAGGESIYLTNPQGVLVDSVQLGLLDDNLSLGRLIDDPLKWATFTAPTPGKVNSGEAFPPVDFGLPVFSRPGCVSKTGVSLSITVPEGNDTIYYTTDGSEPDFLSAKVNGLIEIHESKVIKARILKKGFLPGKIVTNSYIVYDNKELPVVSLSMNPDDLWDWNTGIYVDGPNYDVPMPHYGANYWQDWEKQCHLEIIENSDEQVVSQDAGVKIFGNWSRVSAQKSMAIHARNEYGSDMIKYKIFRNRLFDEFKGLVFRNSGNDWNNTMFRDGLMTSLTVGLNFDQMAYRPSIFFLNGEYWGILNIREKINEHFIASNNGVNSDDVIILENNGSIVNGTNDEWWSMYNFVSKNSLIYPSNYNKVTAQIDINSFIDYYATQIYYANHDWPGNNLRYWKTTDPASRWRWILYDTDFGFGGNNSYFSSNSLAAATKEDGNGWPNPAWSTLLLRKLLENSEFRNQFVNRFADLMNSTFLPDLVVEAIDEKRDAIQNEIGYHLKRWSSGNQASWLAKVQVLKTFATKRPSYMFTHIKEKFTFQDPVQIAVQADPFAGSVQLNSLNLTEFPWQGTYFPDVSVSLTANAYPGYRFVKWEGVTTNSNQKTIIINPKSGVQITAIFESDGSHYEDVVINEISFNNAAQPDPGDWIEIFNKGTQDIDLSGWKITDSDTTHIFVFPSNTWINANDYLVVSNDITKMKVVFGEVKNLIGTLGFGLGNASDAVRLFSKSGLLVDEVNYSNVMPWKNFDLNELWSFELKSPLKNNNSGENWDYSIEYGTPGMRNTNYTPNATYELTLSSGKTELSKNYPNPFTDGTYIEFELDTHGKFQLTVMDITGRVIRNLSADDQFSRMHVVYWDGKDNSGRTVTSGVYFYKIESNGFSEMKRMVKI